MKSRSTVANTAGALLALMTLSLATQAHADLVLETETAQMGKKGEGNVSNAFQVERDRDGVTYLTESQYEVGLSDRSELLIEPFFYERQNPKVGPSVQGVGDLEITYSWIALPETASRPAIILAQKIKVPTATNRDIGTGKVDAQSYVIIGKTWGAVELNINLGYEFIGKVQTTHLRDQFIYDASLDFPVAPKLTLFVEGYGNTTPEIGVKGTQAISFGAEYQLTRHVNAFVAVADDTDDLKIGRIGLNYGW